MTSDFALNTLLIITAILVVVEAVFSALQGRNFYTVKDTFYNFYLMILNTGLAFLMLGITLKALEFFYSYSLNIPMNSIIYWFLLFIILDFAYYVLHLVDHYSRFFWAVHVTHHSSEFFNLTTGFRSSVLQPLYRFVYFIPLTLVGFKPIDILFAHAICQTWGVFVHTQYIGKLPGWIEYIFVTPTHHRIHHASNIPYLDKNMGMLLIIWDRIFGTFQEEQEGEKIKYGLTHDIENLNPVTVIDHEWVALWQDMKKTKSWKEKLKYIFFPPGWSHDGSTMTSNQLRKNQLHSKE
ncbi:MAG TPA: sterol desaturase family protein [Saprospiraceae bacterium]|jgi:sterol desaturase/sphingolipid hydroxylase (fatty acid hydroxylase superfamily)|nr:sterol desaturase family protein [Saprospiraceae bacterium]HQU95790.1 sterol desaturase family protein [Saprospiraceae bacterium]HQW96699.1 sterol desaturase family protein [Saprospiraceae bacterium]